MSGSKQNHGSLSQSDFRKLVLDRQSGAGAQQPTGRQGTPSWPRRGGRGGAAAAAVQATTFLPRNMRQSHQSVTDNVNHNGPNSGVSFANETTISNQPLITKTPDIEIGEEAVILALQSGRLMRDAHLSVDAIRDQEHRPSVGLDLALLEKARQEQKKQQFQFVHTEMKNDQHEGITPKHDLDKKQEPTQNAIRTKRARDILDAAMAVEREDPSRKLAVSFAPRRCAYRFDLAIDVETGRSGAGGRALPVLLKRTDEERKRIVVLHNTLMKMDLS
jgi:hypothetical protein